MTLVEELTVKRTFTKVPRVLVITPDGNRRGSGKDAANADGPHTSGLYNCRTIAQEAFECGVEHVVIWGASESNLRERKEVEVRHLYDLLKQELQLRMRRLQQEKVAFRMCGLWKQFSFWPGLAELVEMVERKTAHHSRCLTVLFGYDGETDTEQATQQLFDAGIRPTKELIRSKLWTAHLPNADLMIRTAVEGDPHDSDSLLPWQRKHTQHVLSQKFWPAFGIADLHAAFEEYAKRPQRKGK